MITYEELQGLARALIHEIKEEGYVTPQTHLEVTITRDYAFDGPGHIDGNVLVHIRMERPGYTFSMKCTAPPDVNDMLEKVMTLMRRPPGLNFD
jgi:hypothetical protein